MSDFGEAKEGLLRVFLRLEHGIPSHDTFSRVFPSLVPRSFEAALRRFMATFAKANSVTLTGVVIEGKAVRGAYQRGERNYPLHLVIVWAVQARMALAQQKAPARNETAGALEALQFLSLKGCIVTSDALHCRREMAKTILDRSGDYVLAIKANRGPLFKRFGRSGKRSSAERLEPSTHDRRGARRATVLRGTTFASVHALPGVVAIGRVTSRRRLHGQRAEPPVVRHYLLSKYMSVTRLLQVMRSHWTIENELH